MIHSRKCKSVPQSFKWGGRKEVNSKECWGGGQISPLLIDKASRNLVLYLPKVAHNKYKGMHLYVCTECGDIYKIYIKEVILLELAMFIIRTIK